MNIQTVAAKIKNIIAKADSTTHPEEADAFMSMAQALMLKHGLSLLDVGKLDEEDPLGSEELGTNGVSDPWRAVVAGRLAALYGCKVIMVRRGNLTTWMGYGRESSRITFALMYPFIDRQVLQLAREAVKAGEFPTKLNARRNIGYALAARIHAMLETNQATAQTGRGLNALVPVDLIEDMIAKAHPNLKNGRAVRYNAAGKRIAGSVSLHHQTGNRAGRGTMIGKN